MSVNRLTDIDYSFRMLNLMEHYSREDARRVQYHTWERHMWGDRIAMDVGNNIFRTIDDGRDMDPRAVY